MKKMISGVRQSILTIMVLATALAGQAGEVKSAKHRFGFQVPIWFNPDATLTGYRGTDPGPNDSSAFRDRFYDDGYNRVDSTGNGVAPAPPANYSFPRTSFFGYASDVQATSIPGVTPATDPDPALTGGTLALHSAAIRGGDYSKLGSQHGIPGIELFYSYDWAEKRKWKLRLESGLSYQHSRWEQKAPVGVLVDLITDVYGLGGVVLPGGTAPYGGVFANTVPGAPVIGSKPSRSESIVTGTVLGSRSLRVDSLHLRLGPSLVWNAAESWELSGSVGMALGWSYSRFDFSDRINLAASAVPSLDQTGSGKGHHLWYGSYLAIRVGHRLSADWWIHTEARRMWQGSFSQSAGSRVARVHSSQEFGILIGLSRLF